MLAGDLFRGTPIGLPLRLFRIAYVCRRMLTGPLVWWRRLTGSGGSRVGLGDTGARGKTEF